MNVKARIVCEIEFTFHLGVVVMSLSLLLIVNPPMENLCKAAIKSCSFPALKLFTTMSLFRLKNVSVWQKSSRQSNVSQQVARTEKVQNCLSPKFAKKFVIDYYFEIVQKLKFGIYDIDNKTIDLSDDDFLGQLECTLGQVRYSSRLLVGRRSSVQNMPV